MEDPATRFTPQRLRAAARTVLVVAALVVLVTACSRPGAQTPTQNRQQQAEARALAYSKCMRAHGVPNYPDPTTSGGGVGIQLSPNSGVDTQSPQFKAAQNDCKKLAPGPGTLTPQQLAQVKADELKTAQCMRSHGYPDFPDPNGQGVIKLPPGIDQNATQFRSALQKCQKGSLIMSSGNGDRGSGAGEAP